MDSLPPTNLKGISMSEKDMFTSAWDKEFQTTMKVLKNYPADQSELRPHEKLKNARELAWNFVGEESVINMALDGNIDFTAFQPAPDSFGEVVRQMESNHAAISARIHGTPEEDLNKTVKFLVGPGQMGDVRILDLLWFTLMDHVHHRGQFSIYLRMAGGKVPSIYGPSADEPWM